MMNSGVILSIKEVYASQIYEGTKKYEYRFLFPQLPTNTKVYLYETDKGITGYVQFLNIVWMDKESASVFYATVTKEFPNDYQIMKDWIGRRKGCWVLTIGNSVKFSEPLPYKYLKDQYNFMAPHNYNYLRDENLQLELITKISV